MPESNETYAEKPTVALDTDMRKYLAALLIAATASSSATAQYWEQDGDPKLGSKMKTRVLKTDYPLDKHYSEFSDEEKAAFRKDYEGMPETETPPFPAENLNAVHEQIGQIAKQRVRNWPRGKMFAIVTVSADGEAKKVEVFQSPGREAAQVTTYVLMDTEFTPADCNGTPCAGEFLWQWDYKDLSVR